ncbi:hypothetical protein [Kosakonia radicincitans]|uniref:Fimbrial protein n=2 Tax=Kosakonia radicincitans TaxID=283686 RepID=A0AAX2EWT1_9ENTR|nr:hypothetical protein [Kosakonia radicincitans]MDP9569189.1 hypothetical protein [Kosakonia oryzae]MDD7998654.1 hypothetical protein [Kosakonia radicincitans]SES72150.1 hypothetical protein SAMN03159294_0295 [Kosakonia radicincitans]SFF20045.1 hypothetical protein SAMN03159468_04137 [Kosakonia radicincitans]SFR22980.1 hypothetical protein SAMN03159514_03928 [Kosakonia radicincitans]
MKRNAFNQQGENDGRLQSDIKNNLFYRMVIFLCRLIGIKSIAFCCLLFTSIIHAATVDITAEFAADISKPQNNQFTNTTPISGFCAEYPAQCASNEDFNAIFSVIVPGLTAERDLITDWAYPTFMTHHPSLTLDATPRAVELIDPATGRRISANFRLVVVGMTFTRLSGNEDLGLAIANSGPPVWAYCGYETADISDRIGKLAWSINGDHKMNCYAQLDSVYEFTGTVAISDVSIGYILKLPDPLNVYGGDYEGEVIYSIGDGGDVDFHGRNTSDSEIRFHIIATVKHAFNIFFPAGSNNLNVKLDAQGSWNQWVNGGRAPDSLTKDVPFLLTSSTPFVVTMRCGIDGGNQNCGLGNGNEKVPLDVSLSLPGFTSNGVGVNNLRLTTAANGVEIDPPGTFLIDQHSYVNFRVPRQGVETMVKSPGSTWKGLVTLVFDTQTQ